METHNQGRTIIRLRSDIRSRMDERIERLNGLGLKSTRDELIQASMDYFVASPDRRALGEQVVREFRANQSDEIPAEVRDADLLVNLAIQLFLERLDQN